ncbi:class I SAM-dependent methyltransferase [Candidatus Igneacidithiobacillus taiwanensis]|uniref:class I SAM-dependent methyltransferase n=1 Tax=Candidatus Igneacidithiobacillus taiwanensis TaxID=1945924 RepID=UPI00289FE1DA|nr:class I SAM-dependent methyltransferase [Candidatus Igneacidithiobacillus taiwanensis]
MNNINESDHRAPPQGDWPTEDLEVLGHCPVCGTTGRFLLYDDLRDKVFFSAPGVWKMWKCEGGGVGYLDPCPTVESIGRAYANYYTHGDWQAGSGLLPGPGRSPVKRIWYALRNDYLNVRYGYRFRPRIPGGRWIMHGFPATRRWLGNRIRHLPAPKPGHNRLLDAGCGSGAFVWVAQILGYRAEGLEIDPKACAQARSHGLVVHQSSFPDTGLESESYDEITMSNVLEHLHDPVGALREVYRILRTGGRLWITVPNLDGASNRVWKGNSRLLEPPRHLVMFNVNSLNGLFLKCGFKNIQQIPIPNINRFIYTASYSITMGSDPESAQWQDLPASLQRQAVQEEKKYSGISPYTDAITFVGFK